jgi:aminopeptidase YwaD
MRARPGLLVLLFAVANLLGCLTADTRTDILRKDLESHITYLAGDSLEGRFVGTPGIEKAGDYIAREFDRIGLQPAFDGSYFQEFEIEVGFELKAPPVFQLGETDLIYGEDFTVLPFSGSGSVSGSTAVLPAGAFPLSDQVPLILIDPEREENRWTMTGRDGLMEWMRDAGTKASEMGAAAIVFLSGGPEESQAPLHQFMLPRTYSPLDIPALEITYDALSRGVSSPGVSMDRVAVHQAYGMKSVDVGLSSACTIEVAAQPARIGVRNVGGVLRGKIPEYIVIGAHYDHLGYGRIGSSTPWRREIHPGADDNASGVAGVIETARLLASYDPPERSLIFLTFTAEELGALGSEHYCKNPPYPIDSTVAMINLDCIGRLQEGNLIAFGAKSAEEFAGLLEEAASEYDINLIEKQEIYGFSDQNPFYARGVPALHFFTGAHSDYHSPEDVPEKINLDGLASVTSVVADFVALVGFRRTQLTPVITVPEESETFRHGEGAHLGIVPDFAYAGTGVGIKGTVPGSPAESAGLEGGDVIVGIDDQPIADLKALMRFLAGSSPGDTIDVQVMRTSVLESAKAVLSVRSPKVHGD